MNRLLTAALLSAGLIIGTGALACEKHLNGHQNSSDTNAEAVRK
jgi:hypothetical protein